MTPQAHRAFTERLVERLAGDPDVLGVVLLGSTSGLPPAPDAFSDHDFFVVVRPGAQERLRTDLSWLPEAAEAALAFRETAHGLKVLYRSGHLAEFAVFDPEELALARVNRYAVPLDRADVAARLVDVSGGGVQLVTRARLPAGLLAQVTLQVAGERFEGLRAVVLASAPAGDGWRSHLEFTGQAGAGRERLAAAVTRAELQRRALDRQSA
jgi:hypothetical protein